MADRYTIMLSYEESIGGTTQIQQIYSESRSVITESEIIKKAEKAFNDFKMENHIRDVTVEIILTYDNGTQILLKEFYKKRES